jgi:uncharacterized membrane protein
MSKQVFRPFFKGLGVLVPVFLVVYILYLSIFGMETMLKKALTSILPYGWYLPGLGIAVVVVALYLVGLLMYPWVTRKMIQSIEKLFRRLPVVGTIYSSVHDVVDLFDGGIKEKLGRPVLVDFPGFELKTLGFLMRKSTSELSQTQVVEEDTVVVYLQMSYQLGGYAIIVPKDRIHPLDMSVEQALQWVLTAGISLSKHRKSE